MPRRGQSYVTFAGGFRRKNLGATLSGNILIVTGASGLVGRILAQAWEAEPPEGLRVLWSSRQPASGRDRLTWDIGAGPAPDWPEGATLLHLAGTTGARSPETNPALIAPLLAACRQNRVRRLVFLSTAAVYAPGPEAARESDPPAPASPYGAAKLEAEHLLSASDLTLTILRLGNLAGADALLGPRDPAALIRLDPIEGEPRGPLRSWIGPVTFARAIAALLLREELPPLLNIAQSPPLGMAELLRASGREWDWAAQNPKVVPVATLDISLLQNLLPLPEAAPDQIITEIGVLAAGMGRP